MGTLIVRSRRLRTRQPSQVIPLASGDMTRGASVWGPQNPFQLTGARVLQASAERSYGGSPVGDGGIGRKWSRVANAGVDFGTTQVITQNSGVTILVVAAPTPGASMKVPFSQRIASGNYTQTDFVFNAATIDSLGAASGNLALTTYHAGSAGVLAAGQVDGKMHCWVAANGPSNGYIFRDGSKQSLSTSTRTSTFTAGTQKLRVGNMADDASTSYACDDPIYLLIVFDRLLPEALAQLLSEKAKRAIAPRRRFTFVDTGGASSGSASGAGQAQSDGTANIALQVILSGVGITVANGVATSSSTIPLAAVGISLTNGIASDQVTVTVSANGIAQAAAQAGLAPSVILAGAAAALAAGNGALATQLQAMAAGGDQVGGTANLSSQSGGQISAAGGDVVSGAAALSIRVEVQASGADQTSGVAAGLVSSAGQLHAAGGSRVDGNAVMSTTISMTAAGFVQAMGQGFWTSIIPLYAFGGALAGGTARLVQPGSGLVSDPKFIVSAAARSYRVKPVGRNYTIARRVQ